jgi:hypothetical protein
MKNSNIQIFKLIDPVFQSALMIFFLFSLDTEKSFSYRTALMLIIGWQVFSIFIHLLFTDTKLLRKERLFCFILIVLYFALHFYFEKNGNEQFFALNEYETPTIPLYSMALASYAILLAFWYNVICYREFKTLHMKINRGNNR